MERRGLRLLGIGALAVSIAVCSNPGQPAHRPDPKDCIGLLNDLAESGHIFRSEPLLPCR
jgi:hypothetical protein